MITAIQNRKIFKSSPFTETAFEDFTDYFFSFLFGGTAGNNLNRFTFAERTPKVFFKQVRIITNQFIGTLQDTCGGTVVLFQLDDLESGVILLQLSDIFRTRPTPGINGLVIIPNGG